jgi:hypothetical protein
MPITGFLYVALVCLEDADDTFLRNVCAHLSNYVAL